MDFTKVVQKSVELKDEFEKVGSVYDKRSRLLDLMEEVGELAQAVQIVEGFKMSRDPKKQKTKVDVVDAICDCLYELVLLSDQYEIDLEKEYLGVLDSLKKRLDSGEFTRDEK